MYLGKPLIAYPSKTRSVSPVPTRTDPKTLHLAISQAWGKLYRLSDSRPKSHNACACAFSNHISKDYSRKVELRAGAQCKNWERERKIFLKDYVSKVSSLDYKLWGITHEKQDLLNFPLYMNTDQKTKRIPLAMIIGFRQERQINSLDFPQISSLVFRAHHIGIC